MLRLSIYTSSSITCENSFMCYGVIRFNCYVSFYIYFGESYVLGL